MNPDNKFKIILTAIFGLFIVVGLVVFATYRSSSSSNQQVEISVWGTIDKTLFDTYIEQYKQDKNLQFKINYTAKSLDTIDPDLVEAIATGRAPDAVLLPQELERRYLDKVYYITSIPLRTFQDTFIDESNIYVQSSGIFALPFAVDPLVMYYNKDLFAGAGLANPPKSWAEFPLLVPKLTITDNGGNVSQSLASLGEYRNVNNAKAIISALMMQAGTPIVKNDNGFLRSALYDRPEGNVIVPAVSALDFYTQYANPQKSVYSWNRSLPSSKQSFLSENLAIYFGFASEINDIKAKNPNLNFDVTPIPQVAGAKNKITFGELYGFSFLKSSPNIVAAYGLISTLLVSADGSSEFSQVSNFAPARKDVIASGTQDPDKSVFYNSALISEGWLDPDLQKTNALFQGMVEDITTGRLDTNTSVQTASNKLDNLLQ